MDKYEAWVHALTVLKHQWLHADNFDPGLAAGFGWLLHAVADESHIGQLDECPFTRAANHRRTMAGDLAGFDRHALNILSPGRIW